ncbi:hypothetical protein pipiens_007774 [Culex pipiens pipiens]|uniref:Uncharacterized protein n=1 Tax=Culex pipiens pipiens TaxID=38569 RepID=A0ABD1DKT1_CULPP
MVDMYSSIAVACAVSEHNVTLCRPHCWNVLANSRSIDHTTNAYPLHGITNIVTSFRQKLCSKEYSGRGEPAPVELELDTFFQRPFQGHLHRDSSLSILFILSRGASYRRHLQGRGLPA